MTRSFAIQQEEYWYGRLQDALRNRHRSLFDRRMRKYHRRSVRHAITQIRHWKAIYYTFDVARGAA